MMLLGESHIFLFPKTYRLFRNSVNMLLYDFSLVSVKHRLQYEHGSKMSIFSLLRVHMMKMHSPKPSTLQKKYCMHQTFRGEIENISTFAHYENGC